MGSKEDLNKPPTPQVIKPPAKFKIQVDPYYPYFPRHSVKRWRANSERVHNWAPSGFLALNLFESGQKHSSKNNLKTIPDLNLIPPAAAYNDFYKEGKRKKIQKFDKGKGILVFGFSKGDNDNYSSSSHSPEEACNNYGATGLNHSSRFGWIY